MYIHTHTHTDRQTHTHTSPGLLHAGETFRLPLLIDVLHHKLKGSPGVVLDEFLLELLQGLGVVCVCVRVCTSVSVCICVGKFRQ